MQFSRKGTFSHPKIVKMLHQNSSAEQTEYWNVILCKRSAAVQYKYTVNVRKCRNSETVFKYTCKQLIIATELLKPGQSAVVFLNECVSFIKRVKGIMQTNLLPLPNKSIHHRFCGN